ncbi:MAG: MFS transporter [Actinomycetota bacterium]|nr:MFS transporter [Actinomycetota bacterium]
MPVVALRPLRHRSFALLWTGSLVSNIGTWMQTVAVGALVTGITRNPVWTAVAFVAGFLPNGILAPIGGALADRLDRRRFAIVGTAVEGSLAATLAVIVGAGNTDPYVITFVVFLAGCVGALRMPFQQAMLPDLVPHEDVVGAISLGSAQWNLGRVIGPALAGLVIVAGSYAAAFAINALSYLAVIVAYLFVRVPPTVPEGEDHGLIRHLRAGVGTVRREPALRAAMGLIAVAAALAAPFIALIPAFADTLTGGSREALAAATGVMTTGQGVGAVIASLLFPSFVERYGRRRMLVVVLILTPLALVPYALSPSVPFAVGAIVVVGGAYICILSGLSAVMQLRAPAAFRGRVLSLYFATLSIVFPLGALVQGVLARQVGLRATTIGGAGLLLIVLAVLGVTRPEVLRALDDEPLDDEPLDERPGDDDALVSDAATAQAAG